MKYLIFSIILCGISIPSLGQNFDTIRLKELQNIVDKIQADSLNDKDYYNRYRPYYEEIYSTFWTIPWKSGLTPEIVEKYEPYADLLAKYDSLYFTAEKYNIPKYDSVIVELYIDGKKQQLQNNFLIFLITADSVYNCHTKLSSFCFPEGLDSVPSYSIFKFKKYNFPLLHLSTTPKKNVYKKVEIYLYKEICKCEEIHLYLENDEKIKGCLRSRPTGGPGLYWLYKLHGNNNRQLIREIDERIYNYIVTCTTNISAELVKNVLSNKTFKNK